MSEVSLRRRRFIRYSSLAALGLISWPIGKQILSWLNPKMSSQYLGISPEIAHQVNHHDFPAVSEHQRKQIVIIGSGIAGLSAARYLYQQGYKDFTILELESNYGGNAAEGRHGDQSYPIAAHYLPILSKESDFLTEFLQEANIIIGFDDEGRPYYNELYVCHDLKERLYINGTWQKGLVPYHGITHQDHQEIGRFFDLMESFKQALGKDHKPAFAIPIAWSSKDPAFLQLDQITLHQFLLEHNYQSPYLFWYLNYCCRDDYGADITQVSAWAGIHYFAARRGLAANVAEDAILTWPEGNAYLTKHLVKDFVNQIQTESLVFEIDTTNKHLVKYYNLKDKKTVAIEAKAVLIATPRFIAQKLVTSAPKLTGYEYSPWLVANVFVKERLKDLAWDNVSYYSRSLGYIDNAHQHLNTHEHARILTYYLPLDEFEPKSARHHALAKSKEAWQELIISDLEKMHPTIRNHINHIDFKILGHGMIRPTPGQIWSRSPSLPRDQNGIFYAHTDMSGISIFEEAYWQGLETAKKLVKKLEKTPLMDQML